MKTKEELNSLFSLFNEIYPMSEGLMKRLEDEFTIYHVNEGRYLLKEKQVNNEVNVIVEGITKSYYLDKQRKEVCTRIMTNNHIVISVSSFFNQQPSYENIVTLTKCVLAKISYDVLQKLYLEFPELNYIIRNITEFYFLQSEQRIRFLRLGTASEKYQYFLSNFPQLADKVPLYTIASFLNISPETLSRVRQKLANKK